MTSHELRGLSPAKLAVIAGVTVSTGQRAILRAWAGDPLTSDELGWFRRFTGTRSGRPRASGYRFFFALFGRRGGKTTRLLALMAASIALNPEYEKNGALGERFVVFIAAPLVEKTTQLMNAIRGIFDALGVQYAERDGNIHLAHYPVDVRSFPMNAVHASSDTAKGVIVDDLCKASLDEASLRHDATWVRSAQAMLASTGGPFVSASQAWARAGIHFDEVEKGFGKVDTDTLVVRGATWELNPTISRDECWKLAGEDPRTFAREYEAQPGHADDSLLNSEDIRACVSPGVRVRPREPGVIYAAAADLGFRHDFSVVAIGSRESRREPDGRERDVAILAALLVHKPTKGRLTDPEVVISEQAAILRAFGVSRVGIDSYSRDLATSRYRHYGITAEEIRNDVASQSRRAELVMSKLRARDIELLDDEEMLRELERLRMTLRSKGAISYAAPATRRDHDDRADALFALVERLQNTPATSRGVRAETAITRSPEGHLSLRTEYFQDRRLPSGESRAVRVAPPRGTRAFDAWACRLLESGVVSSPEVGFDEWLASKLQGRELTPATVASIIADHTFTIPVLFH